MMKSKTVTLILAAALSLASLCGCGAGKEQEPGTSGTPAPAEESVTPAPTEESVTPQAAEENYDGRLVTAGFMDMDYAGCFSVELFQGGYRMVSIDGQAQKYLVVPEGMSVPKDLDETVAVLQQPIENAYLASTNMVALLNAIDALDCVKLVATEEGDWYIDEVKKAMEDGAIAYSGTYKKPDYEKMVEQGIQLHIDTSMVDSVPEVNY